MPLSASASAAAPFGPSWFELKSSRAIGARPCSRASASAAPVSGPRRLPLRLSAVTPELRSTRLASTRPERSPSPRRLKSSSGDPWRSNPIGSAHPSSRPSASSAVLATSASASASAPSAPMAHPCSRSVRSVPLRSSPAASDAAPSVRSPRLPPRSSSVSAVLAVSASPSAAALRGLRPHSRSSRRVRLAWRASAAPSAAPAASRRTFWLSRSVARAPHTSRSAATMSASQDCSRDCVRSASVAAGSSPETTSGVVVVRCARQTATRRGTNFGSLTRPTQRKCFSWGSPPASRTWPRASMSACLRSSSLRSAVREICVAAASSLTSRSTRAAKNVILLVKASVPTGTGDLGPWGAELRASSTEPRNSTRDASGSPALCSATASTAASTRRSRKGSTASMYLALLTTLKRCAPSTLVAAVDASAAAVTARLLNGDSILLVSVRVRERRSAGRAVNLPARTTLATFGKLAFKSVQKRRVTIVL